jgi:hypothetical protein
MLKFSVNGVVIRLTEERWFHITKHHPELKNFRELVLRTVAHPEHVYVFPKTGDLAAVSRFCKLTRVGLASNLIAHYREFSNRDVFIVTAFPISRTRMKRRFNRWQRLK